MVRPADVFVAGGGVAGLTAALGLARAGARVRVIEAQSVLGGRLSSSQGIDVERRGVAMHFPLEHGVHGIWQRYGQLKKLLVSVGEAHRLCPAHEQGFIYRGPTGTPRCLEIGDTVRRSAMPGALAPLSMLKTAEVLSEPGRFLGGGGGAARRMLSLLRFDPTIDLESFDTRNAAEFVGGWSPLFARMMSAMSHAGFFAEPDEVSQAALMMGLWFYGISDKQDSRFHLLDADAGTAVIEPLRKALLEAGAEILTGVRLEAVETEGDRISGVRVRRGGRRVTWRCRNLILALDPAGMRKLESQALKEVFSSYSMPEAVGSTVVRIWYTGAPGDDTPWNGLFAEGPMQNYFWLHRWMNPFDEWYRRTGGGVIEVHLYGASHREALELDDDAILKRVDRTVGWAWPQVGLRLSGHVLRNPATHPLFAPGVLSGLPPIDPPIQGLSLCGDWIRCPEPVLYLERACVTGTLAAHRVAEALQIDAQRLPRLVELRPPSTSVKGLRTILRRFPDPFSEGR